MPAPHPSAGGVVAVACVAAAVVTTGFQGIAPALPATQLALGLDDAQVAAVTTAYLVPSVLVGIPSGLLADRYGRRWTMVVALVVYGLGGLAVLVWHGFAELLTIRALQGAAFGTVLGLTITVIGDVVTGPGQVRAQGRRIVAITVGEAGFPTLAGVLVALGWFVPYALSALALPVAVWAAVVLPRGAGRSGSRAPLRGAVAVLRDPGVLGLQAFAFLRFFLKFTLITYFPIVATREAGLSAAAVGVLLGASSVLGALCAVAVGRWAARIVLWLVMAVALGAEVVAMVLVGAWPVAAVLVVAMPVFGSADGALAVAHNALVTQAVGTGSRAGFVALTGTVRNLGKLAAPVISGALAVVVPVGAVLAVVAVTGAVLGTSVVGVRGLEERLRSADGGPDGG